MHATVKRYTSDYTKETRWAVAVDGYYPPSLDFDTCLKAERVLRKIKRCEHVWLAGSKGDMECSVCGCWTTYCMGPAQADEKTGRCPGRQA